MPLWIPSRSGLVRLVACIALAAWLERETIVIILFADITVGSVTMTPMACVALPLRPSTNALNHDFETGCGCQGTGDDGLDLLVPCDRSVLLGSRVPQTT